MTQRGDIIEFQQVWSGLSYITLCKGSLVSCCVVDSQLHQRWCCSEKNPTELRAPGAVKNHCRVLWSVLCLVSDGVGGLYPWADSSEWMCIMHTHRCCQPLLERYVLGRNSVQGEQNTCDPSAVQSLLPWSLCSLAAPGPPVRLVFPEVRLTSVRIVWQPPEEPNGIILGKMEQQTLGWEWTDGDHSKLQLLGFPVPCT